MLKVTRSKQINTFHQTGLNKGKASKDSYSVEEVVGCSSTVLQNETHFKKTEQAIAEDVEEDNQAKIFSFFSFKF